MAKQSSSIRVGPVEIARQIRLMNVESPTVITNALNIALELSGLQHIRVMMLGGLLRQTAYLLVGPDAEQALARLSADRLFLCVDGVDPLVGVTTPNPLEASLNAVMIRASREATAVFDASKIGQRSLPVIAPPQNLQRVITDSSAPAKKVDALCSAGAEVTLVRHICDPLVNALASTVRLHDPAAFAKHWLGFRQVFRRPSGSVNLSTALKCSKFQAINVGTSALIDA